MAKGKRYKQPMIRRTGGGYIVTRQVCSENEKRFDRNFTRQFCEDAAILAVHKTFGAGEKRIRDFRM
jgi:hypothetical protein